MNPNDQPREFDQPSDQNNQPQSDFNTSPQPESFGQPSASPEFSSTPEATTPVEPTLDQAQPAPQAFGQSVDATQQSQPPVDSPAFPSPEVAPVGQPPVPTGENPGQGLGIASIVVSIFIPLVGIILGFISRSKSKAANAPTTLGTIGVVVGFVSMAISLLLTLLFIVPLMFLAANGDLEDAANNSLNSSNSSFESSSSSSSGLADDAETVTKHAEAYYAINGDYPKYSSDFDKHPESTVDSDINMYTMLVTNNGVTYLYCSPGAAQVVYYEDVAGTKLNITPLGTASSTESCVEIKQ